MVSCGAVRPRPLIEHGRASIVLVPAVAAAAAVVVLGVVLPYLADARLRDAVAADYGGHPVEAQRLAGQARQLVPRGSVYAVEGGNTPFEQDQLAAARAGHRAAAPLGTVN